MAPAGLVTTAVSQAGNTGLRQGSDQKTDVYQPPLVEVAYLRADAGQRGRGRPDAHLLALEALARGLEAIAAELRELATTPAQAEVAP